MHQTCDPNIRSMDGGGYRYNSKRFYKKIILFMFKDKERIIIVQGAYVNFVRTISFLISPLATNIEKEIQLFSH